MIVRHVLLLGLITLPFATLDAQTGSDDRLARGDYAAIVRNQSFCTVSIDRANRTVPPGTDAMIFLSYDIFDAVRPDGSMMSEVPPREIRVDGRLAARVNNATHLEVWVNRDCAVSVYQVRRAELIGNLQARIDALEAERASDRRGKIIGGTIAVLSFGAAAYFSSSDSEDAGTYSAIAVGAGLGALLGSFTMTLFDDEDRRSLEWHKRVLEGINRPF